MPQRSDENDVRQRLLDAAEVLSHTSRGPETTVAELVAHARISARTFYELYGNKDDFFAEFWHFRLELVSRRMAALIAAEDDSLARLRAFGRALESVSDDVASSRDVDLFQLQLAGRRPALVAHAFEPLVALLTGCIEAAQADGHVPPGDARDLAGPMIELLAASVRDRRTGASPMQPAIPLETVIDFCLRGLGISTP